MPNLFDGAYGTILPEAEKLLFADPQRIADLHFAYLRAGARILTTVSFSSRSETEAAQAVRIARQVADNRNPRKDPIMVAASIPPGKGNFARAMKEAGADILLLETIYDSNLAMQDLAQIAPQADRLPIFLSATPDRNGRLLSGERVADFLTSPEILSFYPTAIGLNCGADLESMLRSLEELKEKDPGLPIIFRPSAGVPQDGVYPLSPEEWAEAVRNSGSDYLGGCCGTTPAYIRRLDSYS